MNDMQANSLLRGLVFATQKTRSDITESMGSGPVVDELLAETQPMLFGKDNILARLLDWEARCKKSGIITGSDLFNFTKLLDMRVPTVLALLPIYGYTSIPEEGPSVSWFTQTWPYLSDGLS